MPATGNRRRPVVLLGQGEEEAVGRLHRRLLLVPTSTLPNREEHLDRLPPALDAVARQQQERQRTRHREEDLGVRRLPREIEPRYRTNDLRTWTIAPGNRARAKRITKLFLLSDHLGVERFQASQGS